MKSTKQLIGTLVLVCALFTFSIATAYTGYNNYEAPPTPSITPVVTPSVTPTITPTPETTPTPDPSATPTPTPEIPNTGGGSPKIIIELTPTPSVTPTPGGEVLGTSTIAVISDKGASTTPTAIINLTGPELSCPAYLTTFIKFGATNDVADVKRLQEFLNDHQDAKLPVTGFYGPMTKAEVIKFQKKHSDLVIEPWVKLGLLTNEGGATGYVYKTTTWQINSIKCPGIVLPAPLLP